MRHIHVTYQNPRRFSSRDLAWLLTIALFWFGFGLVTGTILAATEEPPRPNCPTEDSCSVDYRDGEWHITETAP